jgi:CRISPR-associated protein Csb2
MLALEIEYLTGVAVAASAYDRATAEWPPHPDRVFSALVCAWAERGEDDEERKALEWLEALDPPQIAAPPAGRRQVVDVFVPPNDMRVTGKSGQPFPKDARAQLAVLPAMRRNRQPRQFPAAPLPDDVPTVHLVWPQVSSDEVARHRAALDRVARSVVCLGHSSSLVRMALVDEAHPPISHRPGDGGRTLLRRPYVGRLQELVAGFASASKERPFWPSRAPTTAYRETTEESLDVAPSSVFGEEWIVLEDAGGDAPALEAFAIVAKSLRDALMSHADDPVPELLSGHAADGSPSRDPHLAIVPLADVGWRYSGGRLMGVGLVLPRAFEHQLRDLPERRATLRAIAQFSVSEGRDAGALKLGLYGVWRLHRDPQPEAQSLSPWRYLRAGRRWATATPFVFDRFPKDKDGQDAGSIVTQACINIGLPPPIEVELHKHSAFRGAPSARRHHGEPAIAGYRFPRDSALAQRPLRHLVLTFEQPVRGPVIVGAGRFQGLGLCLPLPDENSRDPSA